MQTVGAGLGVEYATDLNNQGQIIFGTMGQTVPEGCLRESGGARTLLVSNLPRAVQGQLTHLQPFSLSNQVSSTDKTVHILATAKDNGADATVVCTRPNVGAWTFAEIQLPAGVTIDDYVTINSSGVIAAIGNAGSGEGHALLLFPIEVDELVSTPPEYPLAKSSQTNDETPNQQALINVTDKITYIVEDDESTYHKPKMPQLIAQIKSPVDNLLFVEWKLDTHFEPRGTKDNKHYPMGNQGINSTRILSIVTPWKIFDEWGNDFFGGTCTLSYRILKSDQHTILNGWKSLTFTIKGRNPDPNVCKSQIVDNQGSIWYVWAIAKHESSDSSDHPYFNQFGNGRKDGKEPAHGEKGDPFHSGEEGRGWGLFQRDDSGLPVTTNEAWSWRDNMLGFINNEYPIHLQAANHYVNGVKANNPATFEEPQFTIQGNKISGRDVLALTMYNGTQKRSNSTLLRFDRNQPAGHRWSIDGLPNAPKKSDSYVEEVDFIGRC